MISTLFLLAAIALGAYAVAMTINATLSAIGPYSRVATLLRAQMAVVIWCGAFVLFHASLITR